MGLDMYFYRGTRKTFNDRVTYFKNLSEFNKVWDKKLEDLHLPKKDNGWGYDKDAFSAEQRAEVEKYVSARQKIEGDRNSINLKEALYYRKFNALHGFIVKTFAAGVDECQSIVIGGKKQIEVIYDALRKTNEELEFGKTENLTLMPTRGFFFGSTEIDEYFKEDVRSAMYDFKRILDSLMDDEILWYEASW